MTLRKLVSHLKTVDKQQKRGRIFFKNRDGGKAWVTYPNSINQHLIHKLSELRGREGGCYLDEKEEDVIADMRKGDGIGKSGNQIAWGVISLVTSYAFFFTTHDCKFTYLFVSMLALLKSSDFLSS